MEFYELKPNSAAGKDAGRVKIAAFLPITTPTP
jgi:hypothetical protein